LGARESAARLWAHAGELCEERLGDVERAMQNHRRGAALGGESSLEALARLHTERDEALEAAGVLEWLCAGSSPERLTARVLMLAEQYLKAGRAKRARARLEQAM